MNKLRWDVLLGMVAVAAIVIAIPVAKHDMDQLVVFPEWVYFGLSIAGAVLGLVALIGMATLLLSAMFSRPSCWCEFRPVSKRDSRKVFELMQEHFGEETPSCTRMMDWQRRNKNVLTAVYCKTLKAGRTKEELVGVFKVFPLTPQTVELLESEKISGSTISANHIAPEGDPVAGLYIGDVVASTRQGRAEVIRQLKHSITVQSNPGIPIYTRPLTTDGGRLVQKYKFVPVMNDVRSGSVGRIHRLLLANEALSVTN